MKRVLTALLTLFLFVSFTQATDADGFASRSLLKKKIFFVAGDGKVQSAEYWSVPMGTFEFNVNREFPGEGTVSVDGEANFALLSSGYIDGSGYGDRGKMAVKPEFAVEENGTLKRIKLEDVDYIYFGGTKVKLKEAAAEQDLFIIIEKDANKVQAKKLGIMVYEVTKPYNELNPTKDVSRIIGISFTKEGATKAYKAALKANE